MLVPVFSGRRVSRGIWSRLVSGRSLCIFQCQSCRDLTEEGGTMWRALFLSLSPPEVARSVFLKKKDHEKKMTHNAKKKKMTHMQGKEQSHWCCQGLGFTSWSHHGKQFLPSSCLILLLERRKTKRLLHGGLQ